MAVDTKELAAEMRRKYARERYAIRRQRQIDGTGTEKASADELTEAYRAFRRREYAKNPNRQKAATERYWERKAAEALKNTQNDL